MYTIIQDNSLIDLIHLSDDTLDQITISSDSITLHFGMLTKRLKIVIDNSLELGKIIIPQKLGPEIIIPDLPYDHYFENDHLFLGPVIGYIAVSKYYEKPALVSLRFINYDRIRGLIFLFRPKTINKENNTISGKYFNPAAKTFVDGVFPYPSVVYNRSPISRATFNHLINHVGNNVFNYPFFNTNKWSFWNWMSEEPAIFPHLPQTTKFTGIVSLLTALGKHKAVYIKPTRLAQGRGILHVSKSDSNYLLSNRFGKKSLLKSPKELAGAIQKKLKTNREYIIQQAIPFTNNSGNKIDFRVYIQKDHSGKWNYSGMETKVAKQGSIISNSSNRQVMMPGKQALSQFFNLNEFQVEQKIAEITRLCIKVLGVMEQNSEHLGDAAIDLVLDQNHKIWLLEVQLNYAADKKARRNETEQQVLPSVLPTPFEYAKTLAGF